MKERVVMFGDAIMAIIITIMVLELPIKYETDGSVDFLPLIRTIGIYFISFCFIANVWFQTASLFNQITKVKNKELVIYMLLLFLLSLVPAATRLLIEDTTTQTVFIYGMVTLLVTTVMSRLSIALTKQYIKNNEIQKYYIKNLNKFEIIDIGLRITLLVIGIFFVKVALVSYLVLSIISFLQNIIDREEYNLVEQLDTNEQVEYLKDRNQVWGTPTKRYSTLMHDFLRNTDNTVSEWENLTRNWQERMQNMKNMKNMQNIPNMPNMPNTPNMPLDKTIEAIENERERIKEIHDMWKQRDKHPDRDADKHHKDKK